MSCDEWREDVSAWVDGELGPRRRIEVDSHLKSCRDCRRVVREFQELTALARRAPAPRAGSELTHAAMALVRAREHRKGWFWWSGPRMFWPQFSLAISGVAVAGFLAVIATNGEFGTFPLFGQNSGDQQVAVVPMQPGQTLLPEAARLAASPSPLPASGAPPPIVGNLVVSNPATGAERIVSLARALGGNTDTVATPEQSTVYVSIPQSARALFQARLPEIGNWQHSPLAATDSGATVIGIRVVKQP